MYNLSKKEKLDFILKKVNELELTAYDIGKKTKLSASGIENILNKTVKNPQENTLDKILLFLESKVLGSELNKVEEHPPIYEKENKNYNFEENPLVICLQEKNKLTLEIIKLQGLLHKNNIDFKNIFEEND